MIPHNLMSGPNNNSLSNQQYQASPIQSLLSQSLQLQQLLAKLLNSQQTQQQQQQQQQPQQYLSPYAGIPPLLSSQIDTLSSNLPQLPTDTTSLANLLSIAASSVAASNNQQQQQQQQQTNRSMMYPETIPAPEGTSSLFAKMKEFINVQQQQQQQQQQRQLDTHQTHLNQRLSPKLSPKYDQFSLDLLESLFDINDCPNVDAIALTAQRINSSFEDVAQWFEARRKSNSKLYNTLANNDHHRTSSSASSLAPATSSSLATYENNRSLSNDQSENESHSEAYDDNSDIDDDIGVQDQQNNISNPENLVDKYLSAYNGINLLDGRLQFLMAPNGNNNSNNNNNITDFDAFQTANMFPSLATAIVNANNNAGANSNNNTNISKKSIEAQLNNGHNNGQQNGKPNHMQALSSSQNPSIPCSSLISKLRVVTQRPDSQVLVKKLDKNIIELLEAFYLVDNNPEAAEIDMIAKRINARTEVIANWFSQRRPGPSAPRIKKREGGRVVTFTEYQRLLLEAIYIENNYLHPFEYDELSKLIQVPSRNIKIWFKNRRSKQRLQSSRA